MSGVGPYVLLHTRDFAKTEWIFRFSGQKGSTCCHDNPLSSLLSKFEGKKNIDHVPFASFYSAAHQKTNEK